MNKTLLLSLFSMMPLVAQEPQIQTNQIKCPLTFNEIRKSDSLTEDIINDLVNTDKHPQAFVVNGMGEFVIVWDEKSEFGNRESKAYDVVFEGDQDAVLHSEYKEIYGSSYSWNTLEKCKKDVLENTVEDQSTKCKTSWITWIRPTDGKILRIYKNSKCRTTMPVNELIKEWAEKIKAKVEQGEK